MAWNFLLHVIYIRLFPSDYTDIAQTSVLGRARAVVEAIEKYNKTIKSLIPDWYPYEQNYEDSTSELYDDHLYDYYGNQVISCLY